VTDPLTTLRDEGSSLAERAAALAQVETLLQAARVLLADDDMPNHWSDCTCSYCRANRSLRDALAPFTNNTP
jgi:hypothetical protein